VKNQTAGHKIIGDFEFRCTVIPSPMMQHHNITIIQLMSVILLSGSTSKASKKEGNIFYHVYKRFFLLLG